MNVLVVNLTRFGDLLQTQPVISAYKKQGHRVGLVCVHNFASVADLLRDLDVFFPFNGAKLLAALDSDWRKSVQLSAEFKEHVRQSFNPDLVINLTPSVSARLLTQGLGVGNLRGFELDDHGFNADSSSWAAFLQMAGGNRGASPFNVCDLFLRAADARGDGTGLLLKAPEAEFREQMRRRLTESLGSTPSGFMGIQLGASENRRRWPIARFARVAEMAWQKLGYAPVLLGTKGEAELGERFEEEAGCPVINMQGKTDLVELAALVSECELLVSNDTGTMHLAAGLGTPTVAVFLATAQPWDTGPYASGCISIEPDLDCHPCSFGRECRFEEKCRYAVSPETVFAQVKAVHSGGKAINHGARVWRSLFDENGFMTLNSLSGHDNLDRYKWIEMQRRFYRRFLDGDDVQGFSDVPHSLSSEFAGELKNIFSTASEYLFLLEQQCMLLVRNPRPALKEKFLAVWQQLQNILSENQAVEVLSSLWMFESQQQGRDLDALMKLVRRYRSLTKVIAEFL